MATYAISDIHGAYDEFLRLLDQIHFHYDGSDSLYLLGDFGDWGEKSMETIRAVREMDLRYEFVHCLRGNHEQMFLEAMEGGIVGDEAKDAAANWLTVNHGLVTWNAYVCLPRQEQEGLHRWLASLPYSCDVVAGGRRFLLAHAYPYYRYMDGTTEEAARRTEAIWRRLLPHENPFADYRGAGHYDMFICGHTVTDYYNRAQYLERNPSVAGSAVQTIRSVMDGGKNRIYHAEHFIDIDCGAKCMAQLQGGDGLLETVHQMLLEQSQLAAYCLDTGGEFYVGRPQTLVGGAVSGTLAPGLPAPEVPAPQLPGYEELLRPLPVLSVLRRDRMYCPQIRAPQPGVPEWAQDRAVKRSEADNSERNRSD